MKPEEFVMWLKGFSAASSQSPNFEQWEKVKTELESVFKKETVKRTLPTSPVIFTGGNVIC